jgi:signal transduction histidine kinase
MNILTLLILAVVLIVLAVGILLGLVFLTFFIYVTSHLYPWLRKIAVWAAKPENLFALLLLAVLLIILIILGATLLHVTLLFLLIVFPLLLFFPIDLGILVWVIRLIRWLYFKWSGLLVGIYAAIRLQVIKLKIKVDVQKETDWKVKFAEMKNKLSEEAEQARRKISRREK